MWYYREQNEHRLDVPPQFVGAWQAEPDPPALFARLQLGPRSIHLSGTLPSLDERLEVTNVFVEKRANQESGHCTLRCRSGESRRRFAFMYEEDGSIFLQEIKANGWGGGDYWNDVGKYVRAAPK